MDAKQVEEAIAALQEATASAEKRFKGLFPMLIEVMRSVRVLNERLLWLERGDPQAVARLALGHVNMEPLQRVDTMLMQIEERKEKKTDG